jgi:transcriptional regulator with XRE-family HTH domain
MHNHTMLRTIRNQKSLTQDQLSEKSGVEQSTISGIETGRIKRPAWEIVCKLARALDTNPEELFPIEEEKVTA